MGYLQGSPCSKKRFYHAVSMNDHDYIFSIKLFARYYSSKENIVTFEDTVVKSK